MAILWYNINSLKYILLSKKFKSIKSKISKLNQKIPPRVGGKMLNKIVKIISILLISILFLNMSANTIYAAIEVNLNKAYIEKIGKADYHLKYYKEDKDKYTYVVCSIVGYYDENDNFNPTYCMNKNLVGAEEESYYVKVNNLLKNDKVWRVIKNGYTFK